MLDYLIVGQGIAGTALAFRFLRQGHRILVVDRNHANSSTRTAAGLLNPITGRKPVKTWLADDLFPFANQYYPQLEALLGERFYFRYPIFKPFGDEGLRDKLLLPEFEPYLRRLPAPNGFDAVLDHNSDGAVVLQGGYINTKRMLWACRRYLAQQSAMLTAQFEYADLVLHDDSVWWKGFNARTLIFCQGYRDMDNPFFADLPLVPNKGELLTIKVAGMPVGHILNKGVFVVPTAMPTLYVAGSTYQNTTDDLPTQQGRERLVAKLDALLKVPYEIVDHRAAIRPTVKDRKPLMGRHAEQPMLALFNGFGTKGLSLAPYFAEPFYAHLERGEPLMPEVDLARYHKKSPGKAGA